MDQNNKTSHAHDKFFREVMSDLRVASDFFNTHLPNKIISILDLDDLKLQPRSSINEIRQESIVDVLYKTKLKKTSEKRDVFLYLLLEHQSRPDKLMPLRILKYICNIMDEHLKDSKNKLLPLVYPIVLFHGKNIYPYSTDIKDLVDAPKELIDLYFLKPFQLIDLGKIEDEKLKQHKWCGVMEFALKHIFVRDAAFIVNKIAKKFRELDQLGGQEYIFLLLQYVFERGKIKNRTEFFHVINNIIKSEVSYEVGEKIMTFWEETMQQNREEGMLQGRVEGRVEGRMEGLNEGKLRKQLQIARNMIKKGLDLYLIASCTDLSVETLENLSKQPELEISQ